MKKYNGHIVEGLNESAQLVSVYPFGKGYYQFTHVHTLDGSDTIPLGLFVDRDTLREYLQNASNVTRDIRYINNSVLTLAAMYYEDVCEQIDRDIVDFTYLQQQSLSQTLIHTDNSISISVKQQLVDGVIYYKLPLSAIPDNMPVNFNIQHRDKLVARVQINEGDYQILCMDNMIIAHDVELGDGMNKPHIHIHSLGSVLYDYAASQSEYLPNNWYSSLSVTAANFRLESITNATACFEKLSLLVGQECHINAKVYSQYALFISGSLSFNNDVVIEGDSSITAEKFYYTAKFCTKKLIATAYLYDQDQTGELIFTGTDADVPNVKSEQDKTQIKSYINATLCYLSGRCKIKHLMLASEHMQWHKANVESHGKLAICNIGTIDIDSLSTLFTDDDTLLSAKNSNCIEATIKNTQSIRDKLLPKLDEKAKILLLKSDVYLQFDGKASLANTRIVVEADQVVFSGAIYNTIYTDDAIFDVRARNYDNRGLISGSSATRIAVDHFNNYGQVISIGGMDVSARDIDLHNGSQVIANHLSLRANREVRLHKFSELMANESSIIHGENIIHKGAIYTPAISCKALNRITVNGDVHASIQMYRAVIFKHRNWWLSADVVDIRALFSTFVGICHAKSYTNTGIFSFFMGAFLAKGFTWPTARMYAFIAANLALSTAQIVCYCIPGAQVAAASISIAQLATILIIRGVYTPPQLVAIYKHYKHLPVNADTVDYVELVAGIEMLAITTVFTALSIASTVIIGHDLYVLTHHAIATASNTTAANACPVNLQHASASTKPPAIAAHSAHSSGSHNVGTISKVNNSAQKPITLWQDKVYNWLIPAPIRHLIGRFEHFLSHTFIPSPVRHAWTNFTAHHPWMRMAPVLFYDWVSYMSIMFANYRDTNLINIRMAFMMCFATMDFHLFMFDPSLIVAGGGVKNVGFLLDPSLGYYIGPVSEAGLIAVHAGHDHHLFGTTNMRFLITSIIRNPCLSSHQQQLFIQSLFNNIVGEQQFTASRFQNLWLNSNSHFQMFASNLSARNITGRGAFELLNSQLKIGTLSNQGDVQFASSVGSVGDRAASSTGMLAIDNSDMKFGNLIVGAGRHVNIRMSNVHGDNMIVQNGGELIASDTQFNFTTHRAESGAEVHMVNCTVEGDKLVWHGRQYLNGVLVAVCQFDNNRVGYYQNVRVAEGDNHSFIYHPGRAVAHGRVADIQSAITHFQRRFTAEYRDGELTYVSVDPHLRFDTIAINSSLPLGYAAGRINFIGVFNHSGRIDLHAEDIDASHLQVHSAGMDHWDASNNVILTDAHIDDQTSIIHAGNVASMQGSSIHSSVDSVFYGDNATQSSAMSGQHHHHHHHHFRFRTMGQSVGVEATSNSHADIQGSSIDAGRIASVGKPGAHVDLGGMHIHAGVRADVHSGGHSSIHDIRGYDTVTKTKIGVLTFYHDKHKIPVTNPSDIKAPIINLSGDDLVVDSSNIHGDTVNVKSGHVTFTNHIMKDTRVNQNIGANVKSVAGVTMPVDKHSLRHMEPLVDALSHIKHADNVYDFISGIVETGLQLANITGHAVSGIAHGHMVKELLNHFHLITPQGGLPVSLQASVGATTTSSEHVSGNMLEANHLNISAKTMDVLNGFAISAKDGNLDVDQLNIVGAALHQYYSNHHIAVNLLTSLLNPIGYGAEASSQTMQATAHQVSQVQIGRCKLNAGTVNTRSGVFKSDQLSGHVDRVNNTLEHDTVKSSGFSASADTMGSGSINASHHHQISTDVLTGIEAKHSENFTVGETHITGHHRSDRSSHGWHAGYSGTFLPAHATVIAEPANGTSHDLFDVGHAIAGYESTHHGHSHHHNVDLVIPHYNPVAAYSLHKSEQLLGKSVLPKPIAEYPHLTIGEKTYVFIPPDQMPAGKDSIEITLDGGQKVIMVPNREVTLYQHDPLPTQDTGGHEYIFVPPGTLPDGTGSIPVPGTDGHVIIVEDRIVHANMQAKPSHNPLPRMDTGGGVEYIFVPPGTLPDGVDGIPVPGTDGHVVIVENRILHTYGDAPSKETDHHQSLLARLNPISTAYADTAPHQQALNVVAGMEQDAASPNNLIQSLDMLLGSTALTHALFTYHDSQLIQALGDFYQDLLTGGRIHPYIPSFLAQYQGGASNVELSEQLDLITHQLNTKIELLLSPTGQSILQVVDKELYQHVNSFGRVQNDTQAAKFFDNLHVIYDRPNVLQKLSCIGLIASWLAAASAGYEVLHSDHKIDTLSELTMGVVGQLATMKIAEQTMFKFMQNEWADNLAYRMSVGGDSRVPSEFLRLTGLTGIGIVGGVVATQLYHHLDRTEVPSLLINAGIPLMHGASIREHAATSFHHDTQDLLTTLYSNISSTDELRSSFNLLQKEYSNLFESVIERSGEMGAGITHYLRPFIPEHAATMLNQAPESAPENIARIFLQSEPTAEVRANLRAAWGVYTHSLATTDLSPIAIRAADIVGKSFLFAGLTMAGEQIIEAGQNWPVEAMHQVALLGTAHIVGTQAAENLAPLLCGPYSFACRLAIGVGAAVAGTEVLDSVVGHIKHMVNTVDDHIQPIDNIHYDSTVNATEADHDTASRHITIGDLLAAVNPISTAHAASYHAMQSMASVDSDAEQHNDLFTIATGTALNAGINGVLDHLLVKQLRDDATAIVSGTNTSNAFRPLSEFYKLKIFNETEARIILDYYSQIVNHRFDANMSIVGDGFLNLSSDNFNSHVMSDIQKVHSETRARINSDNTFVDFEKNFHHAWVNLESNFDGALNEIYLLAQSTGLSHFGKILSVIGGVLALDQIIHSNDKIDTVADISSFMLGQSATAEILHHAMSSDMLAGVKAWLSSNSAIASAVYESMPQRVLYAMRISGVLGTGILGGLAAEQIYQHMNSHELPASLFALSLPLVHDASTIAKHLDQFSQSAAEHIQVQKSLTAQLTHKAEHFKSLVDDKQALIQNIERQTGTISQRILRYFEPMNTDTITALEVPRHIFAMAGISYPSITFSWPQAVVNDSYYDRIHTISSHEDLTMINYLKQLYEAGVDINSRSTLIDIGRTCYILALESHNKDSQQLRSEFDDNTMQQLRDRVMNDDDLALNRGVAFLQRDDLNNPIALELADSYRQYTEEVEQGLVTAAESQAAYHTSTALNTGVQAVRVVGTLLGTAGLAMAGYEVYRAEHHVSEFMHQGRMAASANMGGRLALATAGEVLCAADQLLCPISVGLGGGAISIIVEEHLWPHISDYLDHHISLHNGPSSQAMIAMGQLWPQYSHMDSGDSAQASHTEVTATAMESDDIATQTHRGSTLPSSLYGMVSSIYRAAVNDLPLIDEMASDDAPTPHNMDTTAELSEVHPESTSMELESMTEHAAPESITIQAGNVVHQPKLMKALMEADVISYIPKHIAKAYGFDVSHLADGEQYGLSFQDSTKMMSKTMELLQGAMNEGMQKAKEMGLSGSEASKFAGAYVNESKTMREFAPLATFTPAEEMNANDAITEAGAASHAELEAAVSSEVSTVLPRLFGAIHKVGIAGAVAYGTHQVILSGNHWLGESAHQAALFAVAHQSGKQALLALAPLACGPASPACRIALMVGKFVVPAATSVAAIQLTERIYHHFWQPAVREVNDEQIVTEVGTIAHGYHDAVTVDDGEHLQLATRM